MSSRSLPFILIVSCAGGALFGETKEARPAWTSSLKCLAPLAREARGGAAPLPFEQAFFDGPFSAPDTTTPGSGHGAARLSEGFTRLIQFDDREADRYFRSCLGDEDTAASALLGLAQSNADDHRRAICFLRQAERVLGDRKDLRQWHAYLTQSITPDQTPPDVSAWRDLALNTNCSGIAISLARYLVLSATDGTAVENTIHCLGELAGVASVIGHLPLISTTGGIEASDSPQWTRLMAENRIAAGETDQGVELLIHSLETEQKRLLETGHVMPEATLLMGDTAQRLLSLLIDHGHFDEVTTIAESLLHLPRDPFSVGSRWRRLDRGSTPWVVARKSLAQVAFEQEAWDRLGSLPRGFSSRDKSEWYLWQLLAAVESGADFNLWLAALRREQDGSDLLEAAENYLHWKLEGELLEPLSLPGVPPRFLANSTSSLRLIACNPPADLIIESARRAAPPFTLPDWQQRPVSLADYRGEPVLVIFFLGGGCLHCVEQLTAFGPWTERFEAAGIPILAVSTDPVEILSETLSGVEAPDDAYPIPIVSNGELDVFRAWGAFDDFDNRAIHGTFLLNENGEIIWMETGNAPYMHPDFLLHEANRLLRL